MVDGLAQVHGQPGLTAVVNTGDDGDFYAIDPMLFSPAQVIVTAIDSGESFHKGHVDLKLLDASFM